MGLAVLFFFAVDADLGPRDGLQPGPRDLLLAIDADPVGACFDSLKGDLDRAEQLGVGLFELDADLFFVGGSGAIGKVSVPIRVGLLVDNRPPHRLLELIFLARKGFLVLGQF